MRNNVRESWERDSISAWNYELSRMGQFESWQIVVKKIGTAGNMETYSLAKQVHDLRTDVWEIIPINSKFTGINAREEIYEFLGL